jgi:BNR/Asp-box repeat
MGRWPKHLTWVVLICALAFGVMPAASFGEDDTVGDDDTDDAEAHSRFAPERLFSTPGRRQDDWEPSVAADDHGHVYIATTRFDGPNACQDCPDPAIVFERSDDFGRTWTDPRPVDGPLRWSDKPWIGVSDDGKDVYITFNGPGRSEGTPYTVYSHDAGATWSRPVGGVRTNGLYWFAGGLTVTPEGTAISSQDAYEQDYKGNVLLYALRSEDGGRSWSRVPIAESRQGRRCPRWAGCGLGFLGPQIAIATDEGGRVYVLWNQTSRSGGPARVYLRWSDDEGETWSPARQVSSSNEDRVDSEFPMIDAAGRGDVRVAWMDNRTGRWNAWYRRSTDGGRTWSGAVRLSDRSDGAPYKSSRGFRFPYGDYGQLAVDGRGRTHATWGEGPNYIGPGGAWYTRSRVP